uniref:Zinc finger piccolo-type domain-containing protein n=1 Tax=Seriola dumerili TaxID=41447 RepID=A0A3B4UKX7_SERDU
MQRALGVTEPTGTTSVISQTLAKPEKKDTISPAEREKKESTEPRSPQRKPSVTVQPVTVEGANSIEGQKQASPSPSQTLPQQSQKTPDLNKSPDHTRQAGRKQSNATAATQQESGVSGKMFGFGSSIFSSASTLITSAVQDQPKTTPPVSPKMSPAKDIKSPAAQKKDDQKKPEQPQQTKTPPTVQAKVEKAPSEPPKAVAASQAAVKPGQSTCPLCKSCPLCKAELNLGSKDPPNYNTCTECRTNVCNKCGFSPMQNVTEVREWLCLNCQMQRALGASEPPGLPMIKPQVSPNKDVPATTQKKEPPVSASQEDIPKPATPKNELVNVASTKEIESPAPDVPTKKMIPTAASLPDKTVTSTATKTDVSPASQKPSGETPKGQPDKTQQQPAKAVVSTAKAEAGKPSPQQPPKAGTSPATAAPPPAQPAKQESGGFFGFGSPKTKPAAAKPAESVTGKMFGFGSSFLSSASTLITSAVQDEPKPTPPTPRKMSTTAHVSPKTTPPASPKTVPAKDTKPPAIQKTEEKKPEKPQQDKTPTTVQVRVDKAPSVIPKAPADTQGAPKADQSTCPLCKVELNMGSKDSPNYNTCTECKMTVCNQCGFNPMPNVTEVNQHPHNCLCFHLTYCCYKRELK